VNPPAPNGPGVVNLAQYVTDSSGGTIQTTQIQNAVNATSALNAGAGGVLYVPDGEYLTGALQLKNNVALYLQSGARIQGSSHPSDFPGNWFIGSSGASNVKVFGRGIIDENGSILRPAGSKPRLLQFTGGQNVEVDDVLLRDSASWTVHPNGVTHFVSTNAKIINNQALGADDGIDPDSSNNVTVNRAFVYTYDDCFAVKTTGTDGIAQAASHVLVENSVCWSQKSALKLGTESRYPISNITFDGDNVVHADRAMSMYMNDGASMQGVTYSNDYSEAIGGNNKQMLIDFEISSGQISNVSVTNYTAYSFSPNSSLISGRDASHQISGVAFTNLVIAGVQRLSAASAQITVQWAAGVTFQ